MALDRLRVAAVLEHVLGGLEVERAAHAAVRRERREDRRTVYVTVKYIVNGLNYAQIVPYTPFHVHFFSSELLPL